MSEKFNLKWNDFQFNVSKSFGLFRNEKYLQDITLVSEDMKHVQAHKLVLSACSEYFRNILQQTDTGGKTFLCLDGVYSDDLRNVLDYVYDGEVKIHQEGLDKFLTIAQKLKLEGLMENSEDNDNLHQPQQEAFTAKQEYEDENPNIMEMKMTIAVPKSFTPRQRKPLHQSNTLVVIQSETGEIVSKEEHRQQLYDNVQVNSDDTATCKVCGKTFGGKRKDAMKNARRHVEVHMEGLTYNCSHCDKTFRSKNSFNVHLCTYHK